MNPNSTNFAIQYPHCFGIELIMIYKEIFTVGFKNFCDCNRNCYA